MTNSLQAAAAAALAVAAAGCYTYETIRPEDLAPGRYVRAELRDGNPGGSGLFPVARTYSVEGALLDWTEDVVRLEVIRTDPERPALTLAMRDTVSLSWGYVNRLDQKRLSRGRTAAFVAATSVAGGILLKYLFDQWAGGSRTPPDGGPAESRLPS